MSLLIIAGFECNGLAGALRDLQVAQHCQQAAAVVLTTLTAQSATQLLSTVAVEPAHFDAQLASLHTTPSVIKIGLLPNRQLAQRLAQWLLTLKLKPVIVLDPVMTSSSNDQAFSTEPLLFIIEPLLPWVALLTPNYTELVALTQQQALPDSPQVLAEAFYAQQPNFSGALLVKGGHSGCDNSSVTDWLFERSDNSQYVTHQWQQTRAAKTLRGTGCFLSTAIACAIAEQYNLLDAITLAKAKLAQAMHRQANDESFLGDAAWPVQASVYPRVTGTATLKKPSTPFPRLAVRNGLYPIVDSTSWLTRLATTGIKTIQLRIKNSQGNELKQEIREAVKIANQHNLQLFINDYWQLAIECGAYGVHLGQEDLIDADLVAIHKAGLRLGVSTHGDFERQLAAQLQPSYLAVGAVFPTQTKDMSGQIQGLTRLKRYSQLAGDIPLVAIGGIQAHNIDSVLKCEPDMVAVVSAVTQASNPTLACQQLQQRCLHSARSFNRLNVTECDVPITP